MADYVSNVASGSTFDALMTKINGINPNTLLWSGSWSSGNITVPNFDNYNIFRVQMEGMGTEIIASLNSSFFRGTGGYITDAGNLVTYYFAATVDSNVLTWSGCGNVIHRDSGVELNRDFVVTKIYGVI